MSSGSETSSRIDILRFPLIVGVVFIHNYDTAVHMAQGTIGAAQSSAWVEFVISFISQGVARIAVPLFFLMSGYLFFLGEWSWGKYVSKLKRRFHTLLVPLVFWNALTLLIYAVAQSLPQTKMYFGGNRWPPVYSFSFLNYVNALFGITVTYPMSYPFWFIRDLIALVILAPVLHFLLAKKTSLAFIVILFCFWCSAVWPVLWPSVDATFFFSLGAYLSLPGKSVTYLDRLGPWISAVFLGLLILHSAFPEGPLYLQRAMIVFGVPSLWWLVALAGRIPTLKLWLIRLSGASFFVFAAQEPLLSIFRKISYKLLLPTSGSAILALYFLIPIFLITFLVMVHRFLQSTMPTFLGVITGSANRPQKQSAKEPVVAQN